VTRRHIAHPDPGARWADGSSGLKAHLKAAPPAPEQGEAQWPGEGSFRRRAEYLEHGIALPPPLAAEWEALAREMSLTIAFAACGRNTGMRQ
jgi:LDH2 family malate/lactate/ureidoglycolate dehydrogenase